MAAKKVEAEDMKVENNIADVKEGTKTNEFGEKLVKIKIPRERDNQDDVFVSINERTWQIKRGVEVEVPECVEEVLRHRDEALDIIDEFEQKVQK